MGNDVKLFEGNRIRSIWNNEKKRVVFQHHRCSERFD